MKAYFKEISLALIVVVSALFLIWEWSGRQKTVTRDSSTGEICRTEEFTMNDDWLPGRISAGEKFAAVTNWRECGLSIRRGETVLYRVSKAHEPVARVVAAAPGDLFKLLPVDTGWTIEVEGETFLDSTGEKPYRFGSPAPPLIRLYEEAHQGRLDSTSLLIFSTKSPGHQDSGSLGVVNTADIVGLVRRP